MDFQCRECGATPQGKHEDHYELCGCGMIAVSGGEYPKVDALYPEAYKHYLEEIIMGKMKNFAIDISHKMGKHGELDEEVFEEAENQLGDLIDNIYDKLKDPVPARDPVSQIDEPVMIKYGNNELEMIYGDTRVFYSYTTIVAVYEPEANTIYVAETKYSKTTSKHINKWVSLVKEKEKDCSEGSFKSLSLSLGVKFLH